MSNFNLADAFVALARNHLNRPALISGKRQLTFAELVAAAAQRAHALAAHGIAPNQNVGLALRDGLDTFTYLLALWMIDATGVVVDFRAPAAERAMLADEFDFAAIIADTAPVGAGYPVIALDGEWQEAVARQATTPPPTYGVGHGIAVISLTSGTTGRPLGLLVRHEDTLRRLAQNSQRYAPGLGTHLNLLPLQFSAARATIVAKLLMGWTVHLYSPLFSIDELVPDLQRIAPDSTTFVPTLARGLLDYAETHPFPLFTSLKELSCGGAMMMPDEKRAALRKISPVFSEGYASSLCGSLSRLRSEDIEAHADTVGRLGQLVRLEIVDENDNPVPVGVAGNIRARTPTMVMGTYKDRTRPHGDRLKDGWVYPGDIGSLDAEGFLRILGRSTDVIIRGGANVHPSEVESVIAADPRVKQVAVIGYAAEREGEEIAAFVVAASPVTENELLAVTRSGLAPDKRPRRIILVDEFPLTPIGKLDRKALKARLAGD